MPAILTARRKNYFRGTFEQRDACRPPTDGGSLVAYVRFEGEQATKSGVTNSIILHSVAYHSPRGGRVHAAKTTQIF